MTDTADLIARLRKKDREVLLCKAMHRTCGYGAECMDACREGSCIGRRQARDAMQAYEESLTLSDLRRLAAKHGMVVVPGLRPIDTAPKDGTEILGWRDDAGFFLMRWIAPAEFLTGDELHESRLGENEHWEPDWFYADFLRGGRVDEPPTLWMPLPGAAAKGGDDDG